MKAGVSDAINRCLCTGMGLVIQWLCLEPHYIKQTNIVERQGLILKLVLSDNFSFKLNFQVERLASFWKK